MWADLSRHPHFAGVTHISAVSQAHPHLDFNLQHFLVNEHELNYCALVGVVGVICSVKEDLESLCNTGGS